MFIVFEGVDGSGKSTQLSLLNKYLNDKQINTWATREPGGTPVGEKIRELLLDNNFSEINERTEALLYAAARAQLVGQYIRPKLTEHTVVLCDRYVDSTLAYQGYGRGMDIEFLTKINKLATGDLLPELTIVMDIPPEEGLFRTNKVRQADRLESESLEFYQRVRSGYLELAKDPGRNYLLLDAQQPIDVLHEAICSAVGDLLGI